MACFACRTMALLLAASLPLGPARAQLDGLTGKGAGDLKGLANGLSGQSLKSGSLGNVAGMLQYCISNNYLEGGHDVNSVQEKLMGKLPGGSASTDPGYNDGLAGRLHSSDGKQLDLSGDGLKAQVTKQVCDTVLSQAKSFL